MRAAETRVSHAERLAMQRIETGSDAAKSPIRTCHAERLAMQRIETIPVARRNTAMLSTSR